MLQLCVRRISFGFVSYSFLSLFLIIEKVNCFRCHKSQQIQIQWKLIKNHFNSQQSDVFYAPPSDTYEQREKIHFKLHLFGQINLLTRCLLQVSIFFPFFSIVDIIMTIASRRSNILRIERRNTQFMGNGDRMNTFFL